VSESQAPSRRIEPAGRRVRGLVRGLGQPISSRMARPPHDSGVAATVGCVGRRWDGMNMVWITTTWSSSSLVGSGPQGPGDFSSPSLILSTSKSHAIFPAGVEPLLPHRGGPRGGPRDSPQAAFSQSLAQEGPGLVAVGTRTGPPGIPGCQFVSPSYAISAPRPGGLA
jgi:hypothetical protein